MAAESVYEFRCLCGQDLSGPSRARQCPQCHRLVVVEWPAKLGETAPEDRQ